MKKYLIFLIVLIQNQISLEADLIEKINQKWRWVKYSTDSGLPSDRNVKIIEALDGTIWACTPKGFAWFDGYIWHTVINIKYNITSQQVKDAEPYIHNGVMIISNGNILQVTKEKISEINLNNKIYVKESVCFDNNKLLINSLNIKDSVCTLYLFENGSLHIMEAPGNIKYFSDQVGNVFRDDDGFIFLNIEKGLYLWKLNKWILVKKNFKNEPFDMYSPIINKYGKGYVSFGFPKELQGIWELSIENLRLSFDHKNITILHKADINENGEVVACYLGGIIEIFKKGYRKNILDLPIEIENPSNVIFSNDGNLWISGQLGLYLCRLNNDRWKYIKKNMLIANNFINEIIKYDDSTKIVASDGGLFLLNQHDSLKPFIKNDYSGITGLAKDLDDNIWFSSGSNFPGVYKIIDRKIKYFELNNNPNIRVHKIRKDRSNNLWFLTLSGKLKFDGFGAFQLKDGVFRNWNTSTGLLSNRVYDFLEDTTGAYWFATFKGISRFKENTWTHWTTKNGLKIEMVFALALDKSNRIWFTDNNSSVGYIEEDSIHLKNLLGENDVCKSSYLNFDKQGNLWLSTIGGAYYLNRNALATFNKKVGLLTSAVWPILIDEDKVFIGTTGGGINILNLKEKKEPLPKIFLKYLGETKGNIHFSWKVLSYWGQIPPKDIEVSYKVDDGAWSQWNTSREIMYDDLSYGDHKFTIRAKGIFGDYIGTEKELTFNIPLPFYLSPFFLIPISILLIASISYRYRFNKKRKEVEAEIKQLNVDLERKVEDRTLQLQKALRDIKAEVAIRKQAEEELLMGKNNISKAYYKEKELSVLKSNTFATISKEFHDPLTIISTSAELLEHYYKEHNSKSFREKINNIKRSADSLLQIIDEIIVVGQFDSNKIEIRYEEFDIIDSINAIINHYRTIDADKHVISFKKASERLIYNSDYTFFQHILSNLISNALKFSSEGSEISVDISELDKEILIKVKDNGIGIPNEFIDSIFEPFIRADNISNIQGTGFGLTVVKRSVELLGGEILCQSNINEGTTFSVFLPKDDKQI